MSNATAPTTRSLVEALMSDGLNVPDNRDDYHRLPPEVRRAVEEWVDSHEGVDHRDCYGYNLFDDDIVVFHCYQSDEGSRFMVDGKVAVVDIRRKAHAWPAELLEPGGSPDR